jgi:hypothetical protein
MLWGIVAAEGTDGHSVLLLFEDRDEAESMCKELRHRGHDVTVRPVKRKAAT